MKNLFTGIDNQTPDLGRVLWALAVLTFLGISIKAYGVAGVPFDPTAWGLAVVGVLGGGAAALRIKASTEPTNAQ